MIDTVYMAATLPGPTSLSGSSSMLMLVAAAVLLAYGLMTGPGAD